MAFFGNIAKLAKKNWTFVAVVVVPMLRFLWRLFTRPKKSASVKGAPGNVITGETYKKGDVIDVQVKKQ
jgi:hypothetical protein